MPSVRFRAGPNVALPNDPFQDLAKLAEENRRLRVLLADRLFPSQFGFLNPMDASELYPTANEAIDAALSRFGHLTPRLDSNTEE